MLWDRDCYFLIDVRAGTIPIDHAMFIEPLSCSIHAVARADIGFQDTVVVAGCGPLGLGMIAAALVTSRPVRSSPSATFSLPWMGCAGC
jgi:threonine dehydrogenase-like Zn-dependent dehydrogenase